MVVTNSSNARDAHEGEPKKGKGRRMVTKNYSNGSIYHGELKGSKPHGRGKMTYTPCINSNMGDEFDGEWLNGKRHNGTMRFNEYGVQWGDVYTGDFMQNKFHGIGTLSYRQRKYGCGERKSVIYSGEFKNGLPDGEGTSKFPKCGQEYCGDFKRGSYDGNGSMILATGDKYDGKWKNNLWHGDGTFTCAEDGSVSKCGWKKDKQHGAGTINYANGDKFEGVWRNDKIHGEGKMVCACGDVHLVEFKNGKVNGNATIKFNNGDEYEGECTDYKAHGKGTRKLTNGDVFREVYSNGELVSSKKLNDMINDPPPKRPCLNQAIKSGETDDGEFAEQHPNQTVANPDSDEGQAVEERSAEEINQLNNEGKSSNNEGTDSIKGNGESTQEKQAPIQKDDQNTGQDDLVLPHEESQPLLGSIRGQQALVQQEHHTDGQCTEQEIAQEEVEPVQRGNRMQQLQVQHGHNVYNQDTEDESQANNLVAVKQEELEDDIGSYYYFQVVISNKDTNDVIRLPRRQDLSFGDLRREIEEDVEVPFESFRFVLQSSGKVCVTPKQEKNSKKWPVSHRDFGLMNHGDGSLQNPHRVYIEEAK